MAEFQPIATMRSAFPTKFGIPRQSGLVTELKSTIVFEPAYRNPEMLRGIEGFSHLWLIWSFSKSGDHWSPTVRPPRLGGNQRMGVFATRSPFRPNNIGLSSVRLERVELHTPEGPVLHVSGADLMDGTPIFDIKPYIPYADCHPDAQAGFTAQLDERMVTVECPPELLQRCPPRPRTPSWPSSPTTPDPPTSTTQSGCTAWPSPGGTSGSGCRRRS